MSTLRFATKPNRKKPRKLKKNHNWAWGGPLDGWELTSRRRPPACR